MKLLALDASTQACSVTLKIDEVLFERHQVAPRQQGDLLLKMIAAVLEESGVSFGELDALAFGRGPGAFTGLRIAAGVTQGLALAHNLPVYPVSCLEALACLAFDKTGKEYIAVAQDARMNEVYFAAYCFEKDKCQVINDESVIAPSELVLSDKYKWCAVGTGWQEYRTQFSESVLSICQSFETDLLPRATEIAKLAMCGESISAAEIDVVYLRNKVTY